MLPSHIDAWVQTSPEPMPTAEVALFLHGPERGAPDARVCWRADIALQSEPDISRAIDTLTLCPPSAAETLPVPIGVLRRWLQGESDDAGADIEGTGSDDLGPDERGRHPARDVQPKSPRPVLRWLGRRQGSEPAELVGAGSPLRPGDVIVIPAATGDHRSLGDLPAPLDPRSRLDRGDEAHLRARAKALLRLHPALVDAWPDSPARAAIKALLEQAHEQFEADPDALAAALTQALEQLAGQEPEPGWHWLRDSAAHFARLQPRERRRALLEHPSQGLVLRGTRPLAAYTGEAENFTDEDDASASGTRRVPLLPQSEPQSEPQSGSQSGSRAGPRPDADGAEPVAHLPGVARYARRFAAGCQLSAPLIEALECAGLLHDIGKADPRFQALLHGGNPYARDVLLAKSGELPQTRAGWEAARAAAGYPKRGRHELLSVRLAESAGDGLLPPASDPRRDLILHLIASHHGYCRPFAPGVDDPAPVAVGVNLNGHALNAVAPTELERLDSGVGERFWAQVRRYGWWGAAWLEAILRLADHRRSEAEAGQ